MKTFTLTLALVGAVGLIAGCGGGSADDAAPPAEETEGGSALTRPITKAQEVAADLSNKADEANAAMDAVAAATESRTVTLAIVGMT